METSDRVLLFPWDSAFQNHLPHAELTLTELLPPHHILLQTVLSCLSFSWLQLLINDQGNAVKPFPETSKTKVCFLVCLFEVPTAKNLKVAGLWPTREQSGVDWKQCCIRVLMSKFPFWSVEGWICCPFLDLNSYLNSRVQFYQLLSAKPTQGFTWFAQAFIHLGL